MKPIQLLATLCIVSSSAFAQQQQQVIPFQLQLPKRESGIYTTKNPAAPLGQQALPKNVPFGRASPDALIPVPTGPRTTESAPVGVVEGMEAEAPVYSDIVAGELPDALQDPSKTTLQTGTLFEDKDAPPRPVKLRALNKVTGHSIVTTLPPGGQERFGNLTIQAQLCRSSVENAQPDAAALLTISEQKPDETKPHALFSGWMMASSPSLTGLEHPIYDISVVACDGGPKSAKKDDKSAPSS
ncbi:MAG: DUF2155 domain-containing protein [Rickettsiales bacterium]